MNDCGEKDWATCRKKYGVGIDQGLRSYATLLRKNVTKNELREEKSRPRVYIEWMKKVTSKVFFYSNFLMYILIFLSLKEFKA
jgi:hypothetical protein